MPEVPKPNDKTIMLTYALKGKTFQTEYYYTKADAMEQVSKLGGAQASWSIRPRLHGIGSRQKGLTRLVKSGESFTREF